ncbi:MAG TPA: glycosyltransferase family 87 protein [Candidatus Melainabacteria bacterium]|nr:glycosyltransferase family 87 protein [Candidatus Melainabacteria bacterium]
MKRKFSIPPSTKTFLLLLIYFFGVVLSWIFVEMCSRNTGFADFRLFWGVGDALSRGQVSSIYPRLTDTSFDTTLFNQGVPFLYPPNFAAFSRVFAFLPMVQAYALTRAFLTCSFIAAGVILYLRARRENENAPYALLFFLPALLFFPVQESIGIGQLTGFLYVLSIALGLFFLERQKPMLSGMSFGLLCLKPQPLAAILFAFFCLALFDSAMKRLRLRFFAGFSLVALLNLGAALVLFGWTGILEWAHSVKVWMEFYVWGDRTYFEPYWLICSCPMILGRLVKSLYPQLFFPALPSILSLPALLIELAMIYMLSRSKKLNFSIKLELLLCLVLFSLPVVSPYMRVYDLGVFVIAFWLLFFGCISRLEENQVNGARLVFCVAILFMAIVDFHLVMVPQQLRVEFQHGNLIVGAACLLLWIVYIRFAVITLRK